MALELRVKELGLPEYEELAALTTAEIGEEGRRKVIDGKYFLDIGYKLVNQLLQDFETAEKKAKKKAAEAKVEQEAARVKEDNQDWNLDPEATSTCVCNIASGEASAIRAFRNTTDQARLEILQRTNKEKLLRKIADVQVKDVPQTDVPYVAAPAYIQILPHCMRF